MWVGVGACIGQGLGSAFVLFRGDDQSTADSRCSLSLERLGFVPERIVEHGVHVETACMAGARATHLVVLLMVPMVGSGRLFSCEGVS